MSPSTNNGFNHSPKKLAFFQFSSADNPLLELPPSTQVEYLHTYLSGLLCKSILVEPYYFDRDYLAEFSEFYSTAARGHRNVCQRWHFFSADVDRAKFLEILKGGETQLSEIQDSYLGFSVIRPISKALGKTALRWFDDKDPNFKRIKASRKYKVHVAGIELDVTSLAWQQQDCGVSACATIALWSTIHSAAFDEYYAIPTTAEITKLAHTTTSWGSRVFPSDGLTNYQILEAIKELRLAPIIEMGDYEGTAFSKKHFGLLCSMFIQSGFPIILTGIREGSVVGHAICLTGFRETAPNSVSKIQVSVFNENMDTVYIHDDNIGANARFVVEERTAGPLCAKYKYITLKCEAPPTGTYSSLVLNDPTKKFKNFKPTRMIVALPNEIRLSPETLRKKARIIAVGICELYNKVHKPPQEVEFHLDFRYLKGSDYLGQVLGRALANKTPEILAQTRAKLFEDLPPMSRFLGIARLLFKREPVLDILFDTSDSDPNFSAFGHVSYNAQISVLLKGMEQTHPKLRRILGEPVDAF